LLDLDVPPESLPFDLKSFNTIRYSKEDLAPLKSSFASFLESKRVNNSSSFSQIRQEVLNSYQVMLSWEPRSTRTISPIVRILLERLTTYADEIKKACQGNWQKGEEVVDVHPLPPAAMVDELFGHAIRDLQEGDEYWTFSNLPFWKALFAPDSAKSFLAETSHGVRQAP